MEICSDSVKCKISHCFERAFHAGIIFNWIQSIAITYLNNLQSWTNNKTFLNTITWSQRPVLSGLDSNTFPLPSHQMLNSHQANRGRLHAVHSTDTTKHRIISWWLTPSKKPSNVHSIVCYIIASTKITVFRVWRLFLHWQNKFRDSAWQRDIATIGINRGC